MKWRARIFLGLLFTFAVCACAQLSPQGREVKQQAEVREYWVDPSTGLMWAGKDNGKDVTWPEANKYCHDMRLAGYSDWRLATIDELQGIYDPAAEALGRVSSQTGRPLRFHVKGNLFLTGDQWSSTRRNDDRGRPIGFAWRFDFNNGVRFGYDHLGYSRLKRALCVRQSGER